MCGPLGNTMGGQLKSRIDKTLGVNSLNMRLTRSIDRQIFGKAAVDGAVIPGAPGGAQSPLAGFAGRRSMLKQIPAPKRRT